VALILKEPEPEPVLLVILILFMSMGKPECPVRQDKGWGPRQTKGRDLVRLLGMNSRADPCPWVRRSVLYDKVKVVRAEVDTWQGGCQDFGD
jgi:hypothetical protein